jgi:hypothetical protein
MEFLFFLARRIFMDTNMIFALGTCAVLANLPAIVAHPTLADVVKESKSDAQSDKPDFGSRKYAERLANIFVKEGGEKLADVIKKEVPTQERSKISIEFVGMSFAHAMELMYECASPESLSFQEKEKVMSQVEGLMGGLAKAGCGSAEECKEMVHGFVVPFTLIGTDIFIESFVLHEAIDLQKTNWSSRKKAIFKNDSIVDIEGVEWKDADKRQETLCMLNTAIRMAKDFSGKSLKDILAEQAN